MSKAVAETAASPRNYKSHLSRNGSWLKYLLLLLVLLNVPGCKGCREPSNKIRIGYLPMVSSLPYFVALEERYFVDQDIEIDPSPIKTSNLLAQDLVNGNIDAAIELSIIPLLNTVDMVESAGGGKARTSMTEIPFVIYSTSNITAENGFDGIIVGPKSADTSLCDLSGKRLGTFPGSTSQATIRLVYASQCPNMPPPVYNALDPSLMIQSLLNGDVDAVHAYEPVLTLAQVEHKCRRVHTSIYADQLSPSPIGVAAVNSTWYKQNKALAARYFAAIDSAISFIERRPEESRMILAKYTGVSAAAARTMNIMPMSRSGEINRPVLQRYLGILRDMKEIAREFDEKTICVAR